MKVAVIVSLLALVSAARASFVDVYPAQDAAEQELQDRSKVTDSLVAQLNGEIKRIEAEIKSSNDTNTKLEQDVQDMNANLANANSKKKYLKDKLAKMTKEILAQEALAVQQQNDLKAALESVNKIVQKCNDKLSAHNKFQADETVCPSFPNFKCENKGWCKAKLDTWDNRLEPTCDCLKGFTGHRCETGGKAGKRDGEFEEEGEQEQQEEARSFEESEDQQEEQEEEEERRSFENFAEELYY